VPSEAVIEKAQKLVATGRVRKVDDVQVFDVDGSSGTYQVVLRVGAMSCTCPASGTCSHILAAAQTAIVADIAAAAGPVLGDTPAADSLAAVINQAKAAGYDVTGAEFVDDAIVVHYTRPAGIEARIKLSPISDEERAAGEAAFDAL